MADIPLPVQKKANFERWQMKTDDHANLSGQAGVDFSHDDDYPLTRTVK
jgi:hypothetical protein